MENGLRERTPPCGIRAARLRRPKLAAAGGARLSLSTLHALLTIVAARMLETMGDRACSVRVLIG